MGDEWFKEEKDLDAAGEFLEIFELATKQKKAELIRIFVRSFLKRYKEIKSLFLTLEQQNDSDVFKSHLTGILHETLRLLRKYNQDMSDERVAENLVFALGSVLADIEYGLTTTNYVEVITREDSKQKIIEFTRDIAAQLLVLNKHIKHKFIRNRVQKIAIKHAGKISPSQQRLISQVAAIFTA